MLGALISAGAGLASSFLGKNSAEKAAKQNYQQQKEFAQNGIQWKAADAKAAGIHPLYAMGANTVSFSPTNVGSDFSGLATAGQDIGRAIDATRSNNQRADAFTRTLAAVQLDGAKLDNDIKRADLASKLATVRGQVGPGLPGPETRALWGLDGQGDAPQSDTPEIKRKSTHEVSSPSAPSNVPGAGASVQFVRNSYGGFDPHIPTQLAESYEQDKIGYLKWLAMNRVLPNFTDPLFPPQIPVDFNERAVWDPKWQDWRVKPKRWIRNRYNR